jgi:hypothetical protein
MELADAGYPRNAQCSNELESKLYGYYVSYVSYVSVYV